MTADKWLGLALQVSIALTVLSLGLTATWPDATFLFRRPALLARSVLSMSVVMPIVATLMTTAMALPFEVEIAMVALTVSPVPPILHKRQLAAGGRGEYVVGLLVAMSLLAIFLVPLTVVIFNRLFDHHGLITIGQIATILLKTVFAPLVVGMLINQWVPGAAKIAGTLNAVAGILLGVGSLALLFGMWPIIWKFIGNGVVLMLALLAVIGLAVGHLLGGPRPGDRTVLAFATSLRHPAIALAIATSGPLVQTRPELAAILLYMVVAIVVTIPYQMWRSRSAAVARQRDVPQQATSRRQA